MSMTREEAIEELERLLRHWDDLENDKRCFWGYDNEAVALALSAIRPVSREQVEKVFPGCEKCHNQANWPSWIEKGFVYCPKCGTPLTSWAWEKQMKRLEALKDA